MNLLFKKKKIPREKLNNDISMLKIQNNKLILDLDDKKAKIIFSNKELSKLKKENEEKLNEYKNTLHKLGFENNNLKTKISSLELNLKESKKETIYYNDLIKNYKPKYPDCQRDIIESHVEGLCKSMNECPNFITFLYLGKLKEEYYVLDGQHRLASIKKLKINPQLKIEIIELDTYKEIKDMFLLINNSLEVDKVFVDPNIDILEKTIIRETIRHMQKVYKAYISKGKTAGKPNRPFINISKFSEKLLEMNIVGKKHLTKSIELIKLIEDLNEGYNVVMNNYNNTQVKGLERIKDKILQGNKPFYFGIASRADDKINWERDIIDENVQYSRVSISKILKTQMWKLHIGEIKSSKCFCCLKKKITPTNCEAGHIISVKNGGLTNINNLRPICKSCNRSMSDITMFEYMRNRNLNTKMAMYLQDLYVNMPFLFQKS